MEHVGEVKQAESNNNQERYLKLCMDGETNGDTEM